MKGFPRVTLLVLCVLGACGTPTAAENIAYVNGVRTLHKAGGAPLPFADVNGTSKSEMMSGNLTLNTLNGEDGTCSITIVYRESVNGLVVDQGTETSSCTFGIVFGFLMLDFGPAKTGRFEHHFDNDKGPFRPSLTGSPLPTGMASSSSSVNSC